MAVKKEGRAAPGAPAPVRIPSRIAAVAVYADRAMVTRVGHLGLDVGEGTLVVDGLPADLDEYSLRVSALGPARVRIMGFKIGREYAEGPSAAETLRRQQALEKAEDERRALANRRALVTERAATVKKVADAAAGDLARALARNRLDVGEGEAVISFLFDDLAASDARAAKLDQALREKDRELERLRFEFEKVKSPRPREEKSAEINYECSMGGELDLALSYVMPGAGWEPTYDLRYDEKENTVEIRYRAAVYQQTGEDWDRVQLKLSTARPQEGADPPALEPWYVDFYVPRPAAPPAPASRAVAKQALHDEAAAPAELELAEESVCAAEYAEAVVETGGPAVTYAVAGAPSVPADGEPHLVQVSVHRFTGELVYVVVPERAPVAFRRVKAANESDLTFLAGVTNIFYGDEYVGRGQLARTVPRAELAAHLGADDRLKVKYEAQRRADDAAGFTGSGRKISYKTVTELENLTGAAAQVVVRQRMPVARNKDIKVKVAEQKPKSAEQRDDGVVEWRLALQPAEKLALTFAYDVEFPKDRTVAGA